MLLIILLSAILSPSFAVATCTISLGQYDLIGTQTSEGACRYTVRYGVLQERWGWSTIATDLSNQTTTTLPPSCPQDAGSYAVGSTQSEDCLYAVIYAPPAATPSSQLPVFAWLHGGSFYFGSASAPGLDGSTLAVKGNMIVVLVQYRLGILGFIPPTSAASTVDPNLGMLDVINALHATKLYIGTFGGDSSKVTVGGQSSGAGMIRALWGAPSAQGLFRAAIMQSDPMTYGFASTSITSQLQEAFYSQEPMASCHSLSCLQELSTDDLLSAQDNLLASAPYGITGVPLSEAIRPTYGVASLPLDPTSSLWNSPSSLFISPSTTPLLITTVKNEGGSLTQSLLTDPIPVSNSTYLDVLDELFGSARAQTVFDSGYYYLDPGSTYGADGDEFRETFERLATDAAWRCVNRDAARKWAAAGGRVYVGEWRQGVTYISNAVDGGYCSVSGRVCHEDDIYPTFSTAPSPSSNTTIFEDEISDYWISFITNCNPSPTSTKRAHRHHQPGRSLAHERDAEWALYTTTSTEGEVFPLGGDGDVNACPPVDFWGGAAAYDWQLYG